MSVLIKGMEMPTTCGNCPVHKLWAEDDEAQCMIKRELWTKYSKRNPDCPLIEIPDGHGRLIDADELIKFVELRYDITWDSDNYEGGIKDACTDVLWKIERLPTVIPADKDGESR